MTPPTTIDRRESRKTWLIVGVLALVIVGGGVWILAGLRSRPQVVTTPIHLDLDRVRATVHADNGFVNVDIQVAPDGKTLLVAGEVPSEAQRSELQRMIEAMAIGSPIEWRVEVIHSPL